MKFSVIISVYKTTEYFKRTMEAVMSAMEGRDYEIVVCDDGSDPVYGDGAMARGYAALHPDIVRVIRHDKNEGIRASYQDLVTEAAGEYIIPFDHDDIMLRFDLRQSVLWMDAHPECAATYGKKRYISGTGEDLAIRSGGSASRFLLPFNGRCNHNAMVIRKSSLVDVGGYAAQGFGDITGPVDVTMWMALSEKYDMKYMDEWRSLYRVHDGQVTHGHEQYQEQYVKLRTAYLESRKDIADAIRAGDAAAATAHGSGAAMLVAGAMYADCSDRHIRGEILRLAEEMDPSDPGPLVCAAADAERDGRLNDAMRISESLYARFQNDKYEQWEALQTLARIQSRLSIPHAILGGMYTALSDGMFHMHDEMHAAILREQRICGVMSDMAGSLKDFPTRL